MYVSMSALSYVFLYSIFLGVFFGAVYDLIKLTRIAVSFDRNYELKEYALIGKFFCSKEKTLPRKKGFFYSAFVFVGDVSFCLFAAVSTAIFIYYFNSGEFRAFVLFGSALGFFTYRMTVGKIVIYISEKIIFVAELAFFYIIFFILSPISFLFGKISRIIRIFIQKNVLIIQKLYDIIYVKLYNVRCKRVVLSRASSAFLKDYDKK